MMRRSKLWYGLIFLAAGVVHFPALLTRYLLDDYLHASMIHGTFPARRSPFDLYDFIGDGDRELLRARGMLPWWSDPGLKIRFFRPLSSALLWADHRVLGDAPFMLHVHSLVWWVAATLSMRALLVRMLAPRPALIATAIFALAPCHTLPLAWLANREALVSLTFGLLGLNALLRFCGVGGSSPVPPGRVRDLALAAALFSLSLLGGEYAFGIAGYVTAFVLLARGAPLARRAVGALAYVVPAVGYLVWRAVLGYGTRGSGFYTDPFADPATFVANAPRRLVLLTLNGWLSLDGETVTTKTPAWLLVVGFAVGALAVGALVRRTLREASPEVRDGARWLLLGSALALVPITAVQPSPRLLGASLVGTAAMIGLVLERAWFPPEPAKRAGELGGLVALALAFMHLVHAPVTAWLVARSYQQSSAVFATAASDFGHRLGNVSDAEVFVMRSGAGSFFLPFALDVPGSVGNASTEGSSEITGDGHFAPPARWRILSQTNHVLALRRGPRTLDLVATVRNGIYPPGAGNLFLSDKTPMAVGQTFSFPGMKATVLEMGRESPRVVRFETERDLDAYAWLSEEKTGFHEAEPPAVGMGKPFDL